MKKKTLLTWAKWVGVMFLLTLLISCSGNSDVKIHTVTFDLGYDAPPESVEIEDGAILAPIENPVRNGYQFEGWYTADGTLYEFNTPVTESFTLTVHWRIKSSSGGDDGDGSDIKTHTVTFNYGYDGASSKIV